MHEQTCYSQINSVLPGFDEMLCVIQLGSATFEQMMIYCCCCQFYVPSRCCSILLLMSWCCWGVKHQAPSTSSIQDRHTQYSIQARILWYPLGTIPYIPVFIRVQHRFAIFWWGGECPHCHVHQALRYDNSVRPRLKKKISHHQLLLSPINNQSSIHIIWYQVPAR